MAPLTSGGSAAITPPVWRAGYGRNSSWSQARKGLPTAPSPPFQPRQRGAGSHHNLTVSDSCHSSRPGLAPPPAQLLAMS